jgi:hypothetical protein
MPAIDSNLDRRRDCCVGAHPTPRCRPAKTFDQGLPLLLGWDVWRERSDDAQRHQIRHQHRAPTSDRSPLKSFPPPTECLEDRCRAPSHPRLQAALRRPDRAPSRRSVHSRRRVMAALIPPVRQWLSAIHMAVCAKQPSLPPRACASDTERYATRPPRQKGRSSSSSSNRMRTGGHTTASRNVTPRLALRTSS